MTSPLHPMILFPQQSDSSYHLAPRKNKSNMGSFIRQGCQQFSPLRSQALHAWSHGITIYFVPTRTRYTPLGWFSNLPHTCPSTSSRDELLKTLLLMLFHIWQANNDLPCEMRSCCSYKWPMMRPKDGTLAGSSSEWVRYLPKPQSVVRSPVYIAVGIKNCTQVHYFNRHCTSMFLITKILGLKNRLYKEIVWNSAMVFFQHMHKPVRAVHVSKYKISACKRLQALDSLLGEVLSR